MSTTVCAGVICMPGGSGKSTLCKKYPNIMYDIDDIWDSKQSVESEMTKQWLEAKENNEESERMKLENKCVLYKAQKCRQLHQTLDLQNRVILAQSHQQAQIILNGRNVEARDHWNALSKDYVDLENNFVTNKELHLYPSNELHSINLTKRNDPQWIIDMCKAQKLQLQSFGKYNSKYNRIECKSHQEIQEEVLNFCRCHIRNDHISLINILQSQYRFIPVSICFELTKVIQKYLSQIGGTLS